MSLLELLADVFLGVRCPRHHRHREPCPACQLEAYQRGTATTLIRGSQGGLR